MENNFTTPEYSKCLMDLGLPPETADCMMTGWHEPYLIAVKYNQIGQFNENYVPCWSVGRLIEIYNKCINDTKDGITIPKNHIVLQEVLIEFFGALQYKWLDFSKLND